MNTVCDTLFLPINQGLISRPDETQSVGVFGAEPHPGLAAFSKNNLFLQQYFKPFAHAVEQAGYRVQPGYEGAEERFDYVFVHVPHNAVAARYEIVRALGCLKPGGVLICAADNKAGGTRLKKILSGLRLTDVQEMSKNKARVCWGMKISENLNSHDMDAFLKGGAMQVCTRTSFHSQPGIYGWDKVDQGSALLADVFEGRLNGAVADFGCGYGYLSVRALRNCPDISVLYGLDADARAVEACRLNGSDARHRAVLHYEWVDLTRDVAVRGMDHIIMNPPFHQQKKADISIGVRFIEQAYTALKPGGRLWMVANAHLPYEKVLEGLFPHIQKPHEGAGFKVFIATKS